MEDHLKTELDALFAESETLKEKAVAKRDAEAEAQAAFVADFLTMRDTVALPAFKDFADYIAANGWTGEISSIEPSPGQAGRDGRTTGEQAAGLQMTFFQGTVRPRESAGRSLPSFSLRANKIDKQVWLHADTIGPNHGGSSGSAGSLKLEQATSGGIQRHLVIYFKKLLQDARPYDHR